MNVQTKISYNIIINLIILSFLVKKNIRNFCQFMSEIRECPFFRRNKKGSMQKRGGERNFHCILSIVISVDFCSAKKDDTIDGGVTFDGGDTIDGDY